MTSAKLLCGPGLLILLGTISVGQTPSPPPFNELHVEVINRTGGRIVGSVPPEGRRGGLNLMGGRRIPDWKPSTDVPFAASGLKFEWWLERGSIKLEVQAYLGEAPRDSGRPDLQKLIKIKIASRVLRLDETVTVDETRQVGLEPAQVRVFRAEPLNVAALRAGASSSRVFVVPEIINKLQSLNVEGIDGSGGAYTVTVRNISKKNVIAIGWRGSENERPTAGGRQRGPRLIPPGKLYQIHEQFPTIFRKRDDDSAPEPKQPRQIVLTAILFDDGSFEGEPDAAAAMAANSLGESLQVSRLLQVLETAVASKGDQATTLAKLAADVEALPENADPALASKLLMRFPGVSDEVEQRTVLTELNAGLKSTKMNFRYDLRRFEFQQTHVEAAGQTKAKPTDHQTHKQDLRTWLTEKIDKLKKIHITRLVDLVDSAFVAPNVAQLRGTHASGVLDR